MKKVVISQTELEATKTLVNSLWDALKPFATSPEQLPSALDKYMEKALEKWTADHGASEEALEAFDHPPTKDQIEVLAESGTNAQNEDDLESASSHYRKALALVPTPFFRYAHDASWLLIALADVFREAEQFDVARSAMQLAFYCHGVVENSYAHFLYGQICFLMGDKERAEYELTIAYEMDRSLFDDEHDLLALVKKCIKLRRVRR